jgi:hypothetical protein
LADPSSEKSKPLLEADGMSRVITSSRLTTCNVVKDGGAIRLDFVDAAGAPASVEFPFEQAECIVMTVPQMLSKALQRRTGSRTARYVFSLGRWSIETGDEKSLVLNLKTKDGFEVSFAIPFDTCQAVGWSLKHEGQSALESQTLPRSTDTTSLN